MSQISGKITKLEAVVEAFKMLQWASQIYKCVWRKREENQDKKQATDTGRHVSSLGREKRNLGQHRDTS